MRCDLGRELLDLDGRVLAVVDARRSHSRRNPIRIAFAGGTLGEVDSPRGASLRAWEWPGDAPGALLLHVIANYGRYWDFVTSAVAGRLRLIAPDARCRDRARIARARYGDVVGLGDADGAGVVEPDGDAGLAPGLGEGDSLGEGDGLGGTGQSSPCFGSILITISTSSVDN